jgi:hypothetical protein
MLELVLVLVLGRGLGVRLGLGLGLRLGLGLWRTGGASGRRGRIRGGLQWAGESLSLAGSVPYTGWV